MLIDADLEPPTRLSADVCVIGGGVAGIAVTEALAARGRSVVLCEGGGLGLSPDSFELYAGTCTLSNHLEQVRGHDAYLLGSRLRMLGGTANHWGGSCTFFEAADFEKRDWLPMSGWPISKAELGPYYEEACRTLRIVYPGEYEQDLSSPYPTYDLSFTDALVNTFKQRSTFATEKEIYLSRKLEQVRDTAEVTVAVNANLVSMTADGDGRVRRAGFSNFAGQRFVVESDAYVLSCGGIENARLLLYLAPSLRLRNDNIGRYFMEHLVFKNAGELHLTRDVLGTQLYEHPKLFEGYFELSEEVRRRHGLLGLKIGLRQGNRPSPHALDAALAPPGDVHGSEAVPIRILIGEQAPNPESRVTLSDETDRFGIPRVHLDWRTTELDHRSFAETLRLVAQEFGAKSRGRVRCPFPGARMMENEAGYHHTGTTRMSERPEDGVVDRNARVFGVDNLYVAGSSVFTTSGSAHPTVNLMALSYRLGDYLSSRVFV